MHFPEKLRLLMRASGCTQASLGDVLNLSHRAVGKWLAGDSSPNPSTAKSLADYFGVSVDILLDDNQPLPSAPLPSSAAPPPRATPPTALDPAAMLRTLESIQDQLNTLRAQLKAAANK